ncbi:HAD-IA family hydrolase [Streptococcus fryi]
MKYRDYIWDLGGTLLDNYAVSTQAFRDTLQHFGIEASYDEIYKQLKISTQVAHDYFKIEDGFLQAYKSIEAKYLETPILFKGASDVLTKIVDEGGRNFLVSHRNDSLLAILEKTGILTYFTEVVTSSNGFARKPSPESMLYLKNKYHIDKALVIGDREIDVEAGQAAGFDTLLLPESFDLLEIIE